MLGSFEKTLRLVKAALKVRTFKQNLIASNIANVDTPGYRRRDIPFKKVMEAYLKGNEPELPLKRTNPKHLTNEVSLGIDKFIKAYESPTLGTPNNVSLEEEMTNLAQNQVLYEATLQALSKELQILNDVITEGGR